MTGRGEVFVSQKSHSGQKGIGPVFMREIARVRQACEDIFSSDSGVVLENLIFGLVGRQQSQNELDGKACAADNRFSGKYLGIDGNSRRQRHDLRLPRGALRSRHLVIMASALGIPGSPSSSGPT